MAELKQLKAELAIKKVEMKNLKAEIDDLKMRIKSLKPEIKKKARTSFKLGSKILAIDVGFGKTYETLPELSDVTLYWNLHANIKNPYYKLEKVKSISKSESGLHKVRDDKHMKDVKKVLENQMKFIDEKKYVKNVGDRIKGQRNKEEEQKLKDLIKNLREQNKLDNRRKAIEVKKPKKVWKFGGDE